MENKVILILADGMRPDGMLNCGNPFVAEFLSASSACLDAQTVMPSVTLPCHMSLFHSVPPSRHGILSNTYVPMVRPLDGLFEQLSKADKVCASFYNWEQLRDLSRPSMLNHSFFQAPASRETDVEVTEAMLNYTEKNCPDFVFLYLGGTDAAGHNFGWMGEEYRSTVSAAWDCIEKVYRRFGGEYSIFVTADHGGHERTHGEDIPEDMTIPIILYSKAGYTVPAGATIMDIAPTITEIMGVKPGKDWEGSSLI